MWGRVVFGRAVAALSLTAAACGGSPGGPTPSVAEGPAVQSITPNTGSTAGGTEVTIRGLRFASGATVTIGGSAAVDVLVQGSDTITAKAPAAPAGAANVVVSVAGRSGSLPGGFTYVVPPNNNSPVITAIAVQGTRPLEPPDFADVGVPIAVSATVRDDETASDQLEYRWSASAGAFEGTGARVTWRPPETAAETPMDVTITLRVVERYGPGGIFQQEVTGTRSVSLHDSPRELGDMARRFLTEFSKPQTNRDVNDIMRDFNASACPRPSEVDAEREDVITHYTNFTMNAYDIGPASVQVNFKGRCVVGVSVLEGDACISVPVRWDSTDRRGVQASTSGIDHLTGVYTPAQKRWWLCSSRYQRTGTFGHLFYSVR
jgi:hypothetical protein